LMEFIVMIQKKILCWTLWATYYKEVLD